MSRIEELSQYLCDLVDLQESYVAYYVPDCPNQAGDTCHISKGIYPLYVMIKHSKCKRYLERKLPIQQTYWQRHLLVRSQQINYHGCAIHWKTGPLQGVCVGCMMVHERETHQLIAILYYLKRVLLPELAAIIIGILIHFLWEKMNGETACYMSRIKELSQYLCDLVNQPDFYVAYYVLSCPAIGKCHVSKGVFPLYISYSHDECRQHLMSVFPIQRTFLQRRLLIESEPTCRNSDCAIHWADGHKIHQILQGVCNNCIHVHMDETHHLAITYYCLGRVLLPELAVAIMGFMINFFARQKKQDHNSKGRRNKYCVAHDVNHPP